MDKAVENLIERDADDKTIAQGIIDQIEKMVADRDAKCESAKEQLIEGLRVTSDKYKTATGVYEAFKLLQSLNQDASLFDSATNTGVSMIANNLATISTSMAESAMFLEFDEMNTLCADYYNPNFASSEFNEFTLVEEIMRIDLCRNVGPAADDITEFYNRANEEIEESALKLNEIIEKNPNLTELLPAIPEEIIPTPEED